MKVGYVRVSSKDQNEARQVQSMKENGVDKIYMDKQSGKDFDRPEYQKMISELEEGDVVILHSLDRLLNTTVQGNDLTGKFVSDMVLQILSYVAANERENIRKRQAEGIAIAKAEGKYKNCGRKKKCADGCDDLIQQYAEGKISKARLANMMNVSRPTLNRILKEYEEVEK